jgi:cephalosporin hydroxylase
MSGVGTLMAVMGYEDRTRHEITAELRAHEDLIFKFMQAWYQSAYTFRGTHVKGHLACKMPTDLWILHDLFQQYRFETVIETGTGHGGTTLWYATLMDMMGIDGRVFSIDTEHYDGRPTHSRIEYLRASSIDPDLVEMLRESRRGPVLVNLDSDHRAGHVLAELELYAPLVPLNGWLVVEDTNGAPVITNDAGERVQVEGPFAAVMEYLMKHPGEFLRDVVCERYWLTMNPHGWLQRVAVAK